MGENNAHATYIKTEKTVAIVLLGLFLSVGETAVAPHNSHTTTVPQGFHLSQTDDSRAPRLKLYGSNVSNAIP
jgi:hypothetical protein